MIGRLLLAFIGLGVSTTALAQPSTRIYRVGWLGYTAYNSPDADRNLRADAVLD